MKVARILKTIVVIEWVLGFIYGIIAGANIGLYSEYGGNAFNFWVALQTWIVIFIAGMFQYGFAELLEEVALLREKTDQQLYHLTGTVQHLEGAVVQNAAVKNDMIKL